MKLFCTYVRLAIILVVPIFVVLKSLYATKPDLLPTMMTGEAIAHEINQRDDGKQVTRKILFKLISKSGKTRERVTVGFRKDYEDVTKMVIFYKSPNNVKGTAFLNYDYKEIGREDDRWLYLPATRKIRRIASTERGDRFLGTDLSYEDINHETKVNLNDFTYRNIGEDILDGTLCIQLEALPKNKHVSEELGYGKIVSWVDPENWMLHQVQYWDDKQQLLKTIWFKGIKKIDGIWTVQLIEVKNHQSGHQTKLVFSEIDYKRTVDDVLFNKVQLSKGY